MNDILTIYCDGGARGNPGPAGVGVVIVETDGQEKKIGKFIGNKTNNQAEYEAVLYALETVIAEYKEIARIDFFLDSELVVKQMNSEYKIKNEQLGSLLIKIRNLIVEHDLEVAFKHIPREKNHHADRLVNQAIDQELKKKK
jgi:ribonuclease HI